MGEIKIFNKKRVAILLIMVNLFNEMDPLSRISGAKKQKRNKKPSMLLKNSPSSSDIQSSLDMTALVHRVKSPLFFHILFYCMFDKHVVLSHLSF